MSRVPLNPKDRDQAGMTLVEVLVAVALMAMLAVLIANGTRLTGRIWSMAELQASDVDDIDTVEGLLRRTIARARPSFASADPGDTTIALAGEPDRLTLVAPRSGVAGGGEWVRQVLFVAPHEGSNALILAWQADASGAEAAVSQAVLLDRVASVRFDYFGPPAQGDGPAAWSDTWQDRTSLPELVRVALEREGAGSGAGTVSGPRAWPPLVVQTRVNANAGCLFEPGQTGCRRAGP